MQTLQPKKKQQQQLIQSAKISLKKKQQCIQTTQRVTYEKPI